jgi:hypothetical protein
VSELRVRWTVLQLLGVVTIAGCAGNVVSGSGGSSPGGVAGAAPIATTTPAATATTTATGAGGAPSAGASCEGFPRPISDVYVCDTFTETGCIGAYCDTKYEWVTECTETSCTCMKWLDGQTLESCTCEPTGPNVCVGQPKSCCPFVP